MRKHGLTIDQLISAELVTADGDMVRASEGENPELFWGLRGAAGTSASSPVRVRLNPVGPTVLAGPIFWPMEKSQVLRFYREWIADAPDELMTIVIHRKAPAVSFIPQEMQGEPVVSVVSCWCGSIDEGER